MIPDGDGIIWEVKVTMKKITLSDSAPRKMLSLSERKMLSPAEVEVVYGISRGSLANLRWARKGPRYFKVGSRRIRYRMEDIRAWAESNPVNTID